MAEKFICMIIGKLCVPDDVVGVGWGRGRSGIGISRELSREGWKNGGPRLRRCVQSVCILLIVVLKFNFNAF